MVFERDARKVALEDDACVVDQDLDRDAGCAERVADRLRRARKAEIDRDGLDPPPVARRQFAGELCDRPLVAGRQNKVVSARREGPGEFASDPGGRAGDKDPTLSGALTPGCSCAARRQLFLARAETATP